MELSNFFPAALDLPNAAVLERANQDLAAQVEERKKVEAELEKEKSFLKAMLNSLSVGVVACDQNGILALFNPASKEIFGKPQVPLPPEKWSEYYNLYYPDGQTYLKREDLPLARAYAGETFTDAELMAIPDNSHPKMLVCNGCPIVDPHGAKLGAVVIASDVTQRKQAENDLRRSNIELLHSNQELEQFAYVASHDLREPLRMVTSFTQLLAQRYGSQLDQEADKIIGFAVDGAKRMEILIEDLLLYSRLSKQKQTFKTVDCNLVVEKALSNLQVLIQETEVQIYVQSLPQIVGNEMQLIQLFQNLIDNAITYRSESQAKIKIDAVPQQLGWLFSVQDNGIGIDPGNAKRIFEVFQRLHPKEKYSGTGVGLAICEKIVEQHDGAIWVESATDRGSIFRFTLDVRHDTDVRINDNI